jgi:hypothetical protein
MLFMALASTAMVGSAAAKSDVRSLRGITTIKVLIVDLDVDSVDYGVTNDSLQTQIELELRRTGITVAESTDTIAPIFHLTLTALVARGMHSFGI